MGLILALALTWAAWFPQARGQSFPETVGTEVPVAASELMPTQSRSVVGGILRAADDMRTAATDVCAPFWFTSVAVIWEQASRTPIHANVSVSEDGASFSDPERLGSNPDETPDRGSPEFDASQEGTPLLWTGGAKCVRFSLEIPAGTTISGVRAVFINSSGTAAGPGVAPVLSTGGEPTPDSAAAATADPTIVPRSDWGAPKKPTCGPYYADSVKMAFVHHTDGQNRYPASSSDDILRGILYYHVHARHWCDIAYNFLIDRFGTIFEGRAGGIDLPVISAATQGVNDGSASVALMGNYQRGRPTKPELVALRALLAWRLDVAHVPPDEMTTMTSLGGDNTWLHKGEDVRLRIISGHRNTGYTDCPGIHLYRLLPGIRTSVARMGLPKIFYPGARPAAPGTLPWRIFARGSTALDWTVTIADPSDTVVRTLTLTGAERIRTAWDGKDDAGVEVPPGTYTGTIAASNGAGIARPATVFLKIKAPPSPSPSPTSGP